MKVYFHYNLRRKFVNNHQNWLLWISVFLKSGNWGISKLWEMWLRVLWQLCRGWGVCWHNVVHFRAPPTISDCQFELDVVRAAWHRYENRPGSRALEHFVVVSVFSTNHYLSLFETGSALRFTDKPVRLKHVLSLTNIAKQFQDEKCRWRNQVWKLVWLQLYVIL